ncbi:MAG: signal peptidase I [Huintestinicola sp.]
MAKRRKKNGINVLEGIVITLVIIVIACMLMLYFTFRTSGKPADMFGYTIYQTNAVNMEPKIHEGSAVICKESEKENIKVGSAVLCKIGDDIVVSRVQNVMSENGAVSYVVKFDTAPEAESFKLAEDKIIAKALWTSDFFGKILDFATSTLGIMLVIIIPSFMIIVFQVIRIVNAKRAEEEAASLDDLEEIMIPDYEDNSQITFIEPKIEEKLPEVKPAVLTVDKNGKAGLVTSENSSPLFSYDNVVVSRNEKPKNAQSVQKQPVIVKPEKMPRTQDFFDTYAPKSSQGPLFDESAVQAKRSRGSEYADYLSNVLPEKLNETASGAEVKAAAPAVPVSEPKSVKNSSAADKKLSGTIPSQAVVPNDKIAPPKKQSSRATLSELMSMIDAEESKLKK